MIIDIHVHTIDFRTYDDQPMTPAEPEDLVRLLDRDGVDMAVVLPIVSPETARMELSCNRRVLEACRQFPDRLIPFCGMDPRQHSNRTDADFSWTLQKYKELGCKGVGEVTANLWFDDPRVRNLLGYCQEAQLPFLFHLAYKIGDCYGLADDLHMPRLEAMLQEFPDLIFIGHSQTFWAEMSADLAEEDRNGYPTGPVVEGGAVQRLMREYPNLYGDLSAGSGDNAIRRDLEFGYRFLEEFQDRLLYGTDICSVEQELPQVSFYKEEVVGHISEETRQKILYRNAARILNLDV